MTVLYNLAKVSTATTGTGTITLGAATTGYLTFAQAGVQNGDVVAYGIRDGANSEVGTGTYTSSGTTLTRNVTKSTNSNNPINLSGSAEVYITARSEDIVNKTGDTMTGSLTLLNTGLKVQDTDASHTLSIVPGTNLTANRTLTFTTGDASRNITIQGDTTIPAVFPTSTTDNGVPRFSGTAGNFQTSGVAIDNSNNVTGVLSLDIGNADTTISRASAGVIAVEGSNVLMASNIGSTVQGYNANLNSLASVYTAPTATNPAQFNLLEATNNGSNYLTLLAPNSIASNKNVAFQDVAGTVYVSNGTDVAIADGGTGASDAGTARSNLGLGALATASYPGAGIANSTGSAWGTSYSTSGSGNVALTTSATLTTPVINGFSGDASAITIGTNQLVKDVSGNVGIGTSSPVGNCRLTIVGGSLCFGTAGNQTTQSISDDFGANGYLTFCGGASGYRFNNAGNSLELIRIDSSGNVGLGTSSNLTTLTVYNGNTPSSTNFPVWIRGGFAGTVNDGGAIAFSTAGGSVITTPQKSGSAIRSLNTYGSESNGEQADLAFYTNLRTGANTYTGLTERLRIDSSGNVGLGTSSPQSLLDVKNGTAYSSSGTWLARIQQNVNSSGYNGLSVMNAWAASTSTIFEAAMGFNGITYGYYPVFTINGVGEVIFLPQRTERMRIDQNGNVGIGTSSPGQKLSVAGTVESTSGGFKFPDSTTQTTAFVSGPAFSAYQSSAQSALGANTFTKISLQSEEFDTANCFDTSTYRFTPNVAGYYQINGAVNMSGSTTAFLCSIYKNGSRFKDGNYIGITSSSPLSVASTLIYFNGSTDYVELYALTGTSLAPQATQPGTCFSGCYVRSA